MKDAPVPGCFEMIFISNLITPLQLCSHRATQWGQFGEIHGMRLLKKIAAMLSVSHSCAFIISSGSMESQFSNK